MRQSAAFGWVLTTLAAASCSTSDRDVRDLPPAIEAGPPVDTSTDAATPRESGDSEDAGGFTLIEGRGGSRIAARYLQTADGMQTFSGLFDTKRNRRCVVALLSDARVHCIPGPSETIYAYEFTDAACTAAVASVPKTCTTPPTLVVGSEPASEKCDATLFTVGAAYAGATIFQKTPSGECVSAPRYPDHDYYTTGVPVSPSDYVGFTNGSRALGSRVSVRMLEGDDGSSVPLIRWVDVQRGKGCTIANAADGQLRCLPASRNAIDRSFADPACASPLAFRGGCDPFTLFDDGVATDMRHTRCGITISAFACTPQLAVTATYAKDNGVCGGPYPLGPGYTTFAVGAALAPSTFPELAAGVIGTSRLEEGFAVAGGSAVRRFRIRDKKLAVDCSFQDAADGKLRCMPAEVFAPSGSFADAGCTVPIAEDAPGCGTPKYAHRIDASGCSTVTRVYPLISMFVPAGGLVWRGSPGAWTSSPAISSATYWTIGPEVDPTTFVEGAVVLR